MHGFLKSIGFSQISTVKQEKLLLDSVLEHPKRKKLITNPQEKDGMYAELSREYAPGVGLRIFGQFDEYEQFHLEHYYPYCEGRYLSCEEECYIGRKMDNVSYSGLCDDDRLGGSVIFYMRDTLDCIKNGEPVSEQKKRKVYLAGLVSEGTVLMPTRYTEEVMNDREKSSERAKKLEAAKNGSREAIEELALAEIDAFSDINNRINNEDLLSIVETSFVPFGMETELYKVLGIIESVDSFVNPVLDEKIYIMKLLCNDVVFDICVNEANLSGEPLRGRRFRGILWLQGRVED